MHLLAATPFPLGAINKLYHLTERTKNKIGLGAMLLMVASALLLSFYAFAEFYVGNYGDNVNAKVLDNSELCRRKNKYLVLLVNGETERLKVYGTECREAEFPVNAIVTVKRSNTLNITVLPDNASGIQIVLFPLMTIAAFIGLRQIKRRLQLKQHSEPGDLQNQSQTN